MGRRGYPPEFRRKVLDLLEAGRSVAEVAHDLDISEQSIYTWRRQDPIDKGLVPGLTSKEKAELTAAKKRMLVWLVGGVERARARGPAGRPHVPRRLRRALIPSSAGLRNAQPPD